MPTTTPMPFIPDGSGFRLHLSRPRKSWTSKGAPGGAGVRVLSVVRAFLAVALLLVPGVQRASSQESPWDAGTRETGLLLRGLDGVKRVLVVGAHPDDEDTSLLATLALGWGVETAYLSLTRGEGGQNLLGDELGEGLGLVRTGELLAARGLDGGRQFFSRAFDFGYSKTAVETLDFWPREELLRDVTWVVRTFRPHVIVSVFSDISREGHGHHQVAALMARQGFHAAPDSTRFPDQLEEGAVAWAPTKLYRLTRFSREEPTLRLQTGGFDPLLGRSHHQLAMESRSQHRSQDMGRARPLGPRSSSLVLLESRVSDLPERGGIFAGVDTTLLGLAAPLPPAARRGVEPALETYRRALAGAREELDALEPWRVAPHLARGLRALREARDLVASPGLGPSELARVLPGRVARLERALLAARGVVMDVRVEDDLLVPGEEAGVVVEAWNGGSGPVEDLRASLELPAGWTSEAEGWERVSEEGEDTGTHDSAETLAPGSLIRWRFRVRLPDDARASRLYYLARPRDGALYRWPPDPGLRGRPGNPPRVKARVSLVLESLPVSMSRPAEYRGVDKARGEYREPLLVVPPLSVALEPVWMVWPLGGTREREVAVRVRNDSGDLRRARVDLELSPGWEARPREREVVLEGEGAQASLSFRIRPPGSLEPGVHAVQARVRDDRGDIYREEVILVDYPHIDRSALFRPATTRISSFRVAVAGDPRVAYVMGSGDAGPEALRQMGVPVDLLGPEEVRAGAFGPYDVVVLGIRAYETRPDLVAANDQLLDWVRGGGTLMVQYNKYEFSGAGYAPFPVEMNRPHDRVTDETAPVELLEPDHPALTTPNRITREDFRGWVQERGLYFLGSWDSRYRPLLSMADPGEEAKKGSLLVASLGKGTYIYTGLAFFRQFPAGVPGAFRLFANLISLGAEGSAGDLP